MFGMSSFSELPFSTEQSQTAAVALVGQSLDAVTGTLTITGKGLVTLTGQSLDIVECTVTTAISAL